MIIMSLKLPDDLWQRLRDYCRGSFRVNQSEVVRQALREYLDARERSYMATPIIQERDSGEAELPAADQGEAELPAAELVGSAVQARLEQFAASQGMLEERAGDVLPIKAKLIRQRPSKRSSTLTGGEAGDEPTTRGGASQAGTNRVSDKSAGRKAKVRSVQHPPSNNGKAKPKSKEKRK